jgi:integrase
LELRLPDNPTEADLVVIEQYLKAAKKKVRTGEKAYQNKKTLIAGKLIIFQPTQRIKGDNFSMRYYVGDRKYKVLSLSTNDETVATEKALEKWRILSNHLEQGGSVFEKTIKENLDEYLEHIQGLVDTEQLNIKTLRTKKTSLKKLRLRLELYEKLSDIPVNCLDDYVKWRRTKNWDKSKHINNPKPPTSMTINTELKDFKGFFDYCIKKKRFTKDIEYPFQKIDYKKSVEKNPSFTDEDWKRVVMYSRTWRNKTTTSNGKLRKNNFYRIVFVEFLKILSNSGMRVHEALLLRWSDVKLQKKVEISSTTGKERDRWIAIIQIAPETKTGRREVICPAGIYLKRLKEFYKKEEGQLPKSDDFIFRNVGTKTSKNAHIGNALSDSFLRRLWYEFREDLFKDKEIYFDENYTLHSCRAYYINKRLELGVKPVFVAKLVGHSIKTMEKHYENIKLRQLTPELVNVRRKEMEESDFQTFDMDFL